MKSKFHSKIKKIKNIHVVCYHDVSDHFKLAQGVNGLTHSSSAGLILLGTLYLLAGILIFRHLFAVLRRD